MPVSQTVKQRGCANPLRVCVFLAVECASTRLFEDRPRRVESGTVGVIGGSRVPGAMEMPAQGDAPETNNEIKQGIKAYPTQMRMLPIQF